MTQRPLLNKWNDAIDGLHQLKDTFNWTLLEGIDSELRRLNRNPEADNVAKLKEQLKDAHTLIWNLINECS